MKTKADLGKSEIVVPPRGPGDKPRKAQVAIRASRVRLVKPEAKVCTPDPEALDIGLVEVREIDPPAGVKTARQRNPHAKGSLGWLAWITARLGGWNCYYKPPGPKTMAIG